MTMRERNQLFHEVPLKHVLSKNTSVPVSAVFMDKPEECTSEMDVCNTFSPLLMIYLFTLWSINLYCKSLNFIVKTVLNIHVLKQYMINA